MSVIAGAVVGRTLAIGCDTMSTWGTIRESPTLVAGSSKFVSLQQSLIGVVGNAAYRDALRHYCRQTKEAQSLDSVESIFEWALRFHAALKDEYYYCPEVSGSGGFESTSLEILIGNPHGLFGVYPQRSVMQYRRYYAFGAGFEIAMGAMHHAYGAGLSAKGVVLAALNAAIDLEESCGGDPIVHEIELAT